MSVEIFRCKAKRPGRVCTVTARDGDIKGDYEYHAGPVSVKARGHCIYARGYIIWKGRFADAETSRTVHGRFCD
jgi:hypothetical protein